MKESTIEISRGMESHNELLPCMPKMEEFTYLEECNPYISRNEFRKSHSATFLPCISRGMIPCMPRKNEAHPLDFALAEV